MNMMMKPEKGIRRLLMAPLILGLSFALTACENPVSDGGVHPSGLVVLDGSTEVATFTAPSSATGRITVPAGSTRTFRIVLTDRSGNRIPVDGIEYNLRNLAVLLTTQASAALQGVDNITVTGRAAGTTSLRMQVYHGGHEEFQATIPLVVE
jgi:hypothetical protein